MKRFSIIIVALILLISFSIAQQTVNDRTLTGCKVKFVSTTFASIAPAEAMTSCGFVYAGQHVGKDFANLGKTKVMTTALLSGKTLTIKATGVGVLMAYDITAEK